MMPTLADDCQGKDDQAIACLKDQISKLSRDLDMSQAATRPLENEVAKFDASIKLIQGKINVAVAKQKELVREVAKRETQVAEHYVLFSKKTRDLYKKFRSRTMMSAILSAVGTGQGQREIAYANTAGDQDRQLILGLSAEILKLEQDKKRLDEQKIQLASVQASLDKQAEFFRKEIRGAKAYQNDLSSKIAALSAKQQEILNEKQGTFSTTVGDVPLADDPNSRPDYNPGFSPAFAAFSFGAPHFNGLSQYGAFGRAKEGQNAETILKAYYGDIEVKKDYDKGSRICVGSNKSNCQFVDLETYAKRIYEVPGVWGDQGGMEALKAQAVAARSYALADMARNGFICSTEACQVYKPSNKGGKWEEAVNATSGWVMIKNGKPLWAKYASTAGGYIDPYTDTASSGHTTPGFWDTKNGRSGWTSQAYEKIAESPWFYKGWYKSRSGDSCGRGHPWLNGEEMADIINAWVVITHGSDDRISPIGSCWKGNPYSMSELRSKGGYSSVSGVNISYSDGGYTSNVIFSTDKGDVTIKGSEFKDAFNLRAPGRIALKSALFNIEKK